MEKIYKATLKALGAKPNGTPQTSCVNDAQMFKQLVSLIVIAFTFGAVTFGFKGLPERMKCIETELIILKQEVVATKNINVSIDGRLARIENALINRK